MVRYGVRHGLSVGARNLGIMQVGNVLCSRVHKWETTEHWLCTLCRSGPHVLFLLFISAYLCINKNKRGLHTNTKALTHAHMHNMGYVFMVDVHIFLLYSRVYKTKCREPIHFMRFSEGLNSYIIRMNASSFSTFFKLCPSNLIITFAFTRYKLFFPWHFSCIS